MPLVIELSPRQIVTFEKIGKNSRPTVSKRSRWPEKRGHPAVPRRHWPDAEQAAAEILDGHRAETRPSH